MSTNVDIHLTPADQEMAIQVTASALVAVPAARPASEHDTLLRLTTFRPTPTATVVRVAGELDAATAPRLTRLLGPRLSSALRTLVIDVSEVTFLGAAGLSALANAHHQASITGRNLTVITGPRCVDRPLAITGLATELACYPARTTEHA